MAKLFDNYFAIYNIENSPNYPDLSQIVLNILLITEWTLKRFAKTLGDSKTILNEPVLMNWHKH